MKQHVKDINEALSAVLAELQEQRKTIDSQHVEICSLNRNVDKLIKENRELRKRLAKYEKPPRDSGNNSILLVADGGNCEPDLSKNLTRATASKSIIF